MESSSGHTGLWGSRLGFYVTRQARVPRAHSEDLLTWCSACERCGLLVVVQSALRVRLSEGLLHAASFLLVVVPD